MSSFRPWLVAVISVIALVIALLGCGGSSCDEAIDWNEASSHVGEATTVSGPVEGAKYADYVSGSPTFLNLGADYPSRQRFTALIWGGDRSKFSPPPEEAYDGEVIAVKGTVTSYEGVPEIEVSDPEQIEVCPG